MVKETIYPTYGRRQSSHLTSTGVAHQYIPGYYFPDSKFESFFRQPLPPALVHPDHVTDSKSFPTTTGVYHDPKYKSGVYDGENYPKAPSSRKVGYVKDLSEKISPGGWRKPLTMGYQKSEYCDNYDAKPGLRSEYNYEEVFSKQPYLLYDHLHDGPTKYGEGSSHNPKLTGIPWYVRDKSILRHLDPYLSTTHKDHCRWTDPELKSYPKKDAATYWECEEYPKSWGYGSKRNPLPRSSIPQGKLPMRDTSVSVFKYETRIPRIPNSLIHVPHSGLKSLYMDSYLTPSRYQRGFAESVDTPYVLPDAGLKSIMTAPMMYQTEHSNIGSQRPVTVPTL